MSDEQQTTPEEESPVSPSTGNRDRPEYVDERFRRYVKRSRVLREYRRQDAKHVAQAIAEFDEPYRSVLLLHKIENLNIEEIAEALDMPAPAVRRYVHRGRRELWRRFHRGRRREKWRRSGKNLDLKAEEVSYDVHSPYSPPETLDTLEAESSGIQDIQTPHSSVSDLRLSTRISIAVFESDRVRKMAKSALLGLGIGAVFIALTYGLSLLNPSGAVLNGLILILALTSVAATVLASDIVFTSDQDRDFKYLF